MLAGDSELTVEAVDIDIPEIQSLNLIEIITDKAQKAYAAVGKPVLVEDISAGLDELGGLPGPFIKYFEQTLGKGALHKMASNNHAPALLSAVMAYYDGSTLLTATSELRGHVVPPAGGEGWGFDFCFVPDGASQTFSEMGPEAKDQMSHRSRAMQNLVGQIAILP
jgi:non-canonical purine NTP pyrophosphatase (RdgB/HAM1 family)